MIIIYISSKHFQDWVNLACAPRNAAPVHAKCNLKVNGCNLLLIDFLCLSPGAQYVKCRAQRCAEGNRQRLFPGYVDTNSLVVQDEYVFTQVWNVTDYFVP